MKQCWNKANLKIPLKIIVQSQNLLSDNIYFISCSFIHTIHSHILTSMNICRGSSLFPHRWTAQWQTPPWGAELGFELGPALQRADVLPTEPCRTLTEPFRTLLSHAAPYHISIMPCLMLFKFQTFKPSSHKINKREYGKSFNLADFLSIFCMHQTMFLLYVCQVPAKLFCQCSILSSVCRNLTT